MPSGFSPGRAGLAYREQGRDVEAAAALARYEQIAVAGEP